MSRMARSSLPRPTWTKPGHGRGLALVLFMTMPCWAHGPVSTDWPVERVAANLEERLKSSPEDASLHYQLGRTLAFAFALERQRFSSADLGFTADPSKRGSLLSPPPTPEDSIRYLSSAVQHLRRAIEL